MRSPHRPSRKWDTTATLRINLNIDGVSIPSRSHSHKERSESFSRTKKNVFILYQSLLTFDGSIEDHLGMKKKEIKFQKSLRAVRDSGVYIIYIYNYMKRVIKVNVIV
jgi:hypothetical protein